MFSQTGSRHFLLLLCALCSLFGCASTGGQSTGGQFAESLAIESWQCRNDLEINCHEGRCAAEVDGGFTPMSIDVDDSGSISVCAYSGCWEGTGEILRSGTFLLLIGHDLPFSTSPDAEQKEDIAITIDRNDGVGILKVGTFAHPVLCKSQGAAPQN